jgi:hypothetical protein
MNDRVVGGRLGQHLLADGVGFLHTHTHTTLHVQVWGHTARGLCLRVRESYLLLRQVVEDERLDRLVGRIGVRLKKIILFLSILKGLNSTERQGRTRAICDSGCFFR